MHRVAATLVAMLTLGACGASTAPQALVPAHNICNEPRPQVCTMEYLPVCATLVAGGRREYASACNACADDAVLSFEHDVCPQLPPPLTQ